MSALEQAAREVRETCVCIGLRQASRAVTQAYDDAIAGSGVRATQFGLLVALAHAKLVPLSKLAEVLVMDRTTLTRNLAPLVREGLAEERPMADKRVRAFALTEQGRKVFERALPGWKKAQARIVRALAASELEQLSRTLGAVVQAAQKS
jgi:DNA-binding MarR family transcriptional regulator